VSEDKTIRCWDLSQEAKCVKVVANAHEHFITDIRWAPDMNLHVNGITNGENNAATSIPGQQPDKGGGKIRCVIATSSVDKNVRVFAG